MIEEPVLDVDQIQGNIFPGFKKDHQHFLFFQVKDPVLARAWLKGLVPRISTAREVLKSHELWKSMKRKTGKDPDNLDFLFLNCAFSIEALKRFAITGWEQFDDAAFKIGLEQRAASIGDPPPGSGENGSPETWLFGSGSKIADVVLMLASDDLNWTSGYAGTLTADAEANGLARIHKDEGSVRLGAFSGHEHFGFKDGISFPAIRGRASGAPGDFLEPRSWPPDPQFDGIRNLHASPGRQLVWPGHFLFGYPRQLKDNPEQPRPAAPAPAWAKNGSFMVYRRLNQDVPKFHAFLKTAANTLRSAGYDPTTTPESLGAKLVGRWPSGWPVMRSDKDEGSNQQGENYFGYTEQAVNKLPGDPHPLNDADPEGAVCPFAAHTRKVQPRDDSTDQGGKQRTFLKLLIRRGITYGPEMLTENDNMDRGLLFVAYQSSITEQFEFIMNDWVNEPNKPKSGAGPDPILAGSKDFTVNLKYNMQTYPLVIPGKWVTATGGGYFFSPGIDFFTSVL